MPTGSPGSVRNFWYSYDRNYIHWLMFSTEHDYDPGSPQYAFIEQDLQRAVQNRRNVPWIIFNGHRPLYSSDAAQYDSHRPGCRLLTALEPLLVKYNVDIVMTGHMHCYERSYPVNNGTVDTASVRNINTIVNPAYPIYIVQVRSVGPIGSNLTDFKATGNGRSLDWRRMDPTKASLGCIPNGTIWIRKIDCLQWHHLVL